VKDLYALEDGLAFSLGAGDTLWGSPVRNRFIRLPPAVADACHLFQGARTLAEYAALLSSRLVGLGQADAVALLDGLVAERLLRKATIGPPDPPRSRGVSVAGVITCDRPALLTRCLTSMGRDCRSGGSVRRLLVADGSADAATMLANGAVIRECQTTSVPITHFHREEIIEFCHNLATFHDEEVLLHFALANGSSGANRNVLTLLTAGEMLVACDDDVVWDTFQAKACGSVTRLVGHAEPWNVAYFQSREDAKAALVKRPVSVVAAFDGILGQSIRNIVHKAGADLNLDWACPHLLNALTSPDIYRIKTAYPGIVGDSGQECHHRLLLGNGAATQAAARDAGSWRTALGFREIARIVEGLTIAHDPWSMGYTFGLDNTGLSMPFMPIGRGEDGLFATITSWCDPLALVAHLPIAVLHDSTRTAALTSVPLTATRTSFSEVIQLIIGTSTIPPFVGTPAGRLRILADLLEGVAALHTNAFEECIRDRILRARLTQLEVARELLDGLDYCPSFRKDSLEAYVTTLVSAMQTPEFWLPYDCKPESGPGMTRRAIANCALVCQLWPEWWRRASEYNQARQPM
jgi:hypothetical protein